jgi:signal transduction histidine kinase
VGRGLTARIVVASALLALLVGGAFGRLIVALYRERHSFDLTRESQDVLLAANRLERLVIDLETGERGFLITGEERFLEPWNAARSTVPRASGELERVVVVPVQKRRVQSIVEDINSYLRDYSTPLLDSARRGDPSARSVTTIEEGKLRVDRIRAEFDELLTAEQDLAAARERGARAATRVAIVAAVGGLAGSIVLIVVFSGYLARALVQPVRRASAMAGRLAGGDLTVRMPETGTAEIGALERSFNIMASSLQASRHELGLLLDEQAALRRVATLVARGVAPTDVFDSVAQEVCRLLGAQSAGLVRSEPDGTATIVAAHGHVNLPIGTRITLTSDTVPGSVLHTGRPGRMDIAEGADDGVSERLRELGIRSMVGTPVLVEARRWGVMVATWPEIGAMSEEAEARMAQFTELVATAIANADSRAELTASRARVVAAGDEARRKIERDLHDGIQQRLVSLGLELRATEAIVPSALPELQSQLSRTARGLAATVGELQEVSRGIHPAILSRGGLGAALKGLARRAAVAVELDLRVAHRLPGPVEVAAYYVVSEALTNAAKHAQASVVEVCVDADDSLLRVSVSDDGVGGADPGRGSGLVGLRDRVESVGGRLEITSAAGSGTSLVVTMPIAAG